MAESAAQEVQLLPAQENVPHGAPNRAIQEEDSPGILHEAVADLRRGFVILYYCIIATFLSALQFLHVLFCSNRDAAPQRRYLGNKGGERPANC